MVQEMFRIIGSVVVVGVLLAAHAHAQGTRQASSSTSGKPLVLVNLNTAGVPELAALPGIGEKTAGRIVDYREKNGPFKKIEELMNVQGIGEKSFLKLKPQLTVSAKPESSSNASKQQ
jgi:competence protein ComEA